MMTETPPTTEFLQIIIDFGLDLFEAFLGFLVAALPSILSGVFMLIGQIIQPPMV